MECVLLSVFSKSCAFSLGLIDNTLQAFIVRYQLIQIAHNTRVEQREMRQLHWKFARN